MTSHDNPSNMELPADPPRDLLLPYLLLGVAFGLVLTKSEVISWFRIQEMFRFQSFHMYGIIGSAILVGALSTRLLIRLRPEALNGDPICIPQERSARSPRLWLGGLLFGLGWGLVGSCPGPIFALLGHGVSLMVIVLVAALLGTWTYSFLRPYLPH